MRNIGFEGSKLLFKAKSSGGTELSPARRAGVWSQSRDLRAMLRPHPSITSCKSTLVQRLAGMSLMGCPASQGAARTWDGPARFRTPQSTALLPARGCASIPAALPAALELEQGACQTVLAGATEGGEQQMPCEMHWGGRGCDPPLSFLL